jgi:hypothetical protein
MVAVINHTLVMPHLVKSWEPLKDSASSLKAQKHLKMRSKPHYPSWRLFRYFEQVVC